MVVGCYAYHDRIRNPACVIKHPTCNGIEPYAAFASCIFDCFSAPLEIAMIGLPGILQIRAGGFHCDDGCIPGLDFKQGGAQVLNPDITSCLFVFFFGTGKKDYC